MDLAGGLRAVVLFSCTEHLYKLQLKTTDSQLKSGSRVNSGQGGFYSKLPACISDLVYVCVCAHVLAYTCTCVCVP